MSAVRILSTEIVVKLSACKHRIASEDSLTLPNDYSPAMTVACWLSSLLPEL
jgi:hypothetical protein